MSIIMLDKTIYQIQTEAFRQLKLSLLLLPFYGVIEHFSDISEEKKADDIWSGHQRTWPNFLEKEICKISLADKPGKST